MPLLDTDKIKQAFAFYLAHFQVLALISCVSGLISSLDEVARMAGANEVFVVALMLMAVISNFAIFILTMYVLYQLYTGAPLSRAECGRVFRRDMGRVAWAYLRVTVMIFFYGVAATLPMALVMAFTSNKLLAVLAIIPFAILWVFTTVRYWFIPYFVLFESNLTYGQAYRKSVLYTYPRRARLLLSAGAVTLMVMVPSVVIMQGLEMFSGKGGVPMIIGNLLVSVMGMPMAILIFLFFMEARNTVVLKDLDDTGH